MFKKAVFTAVVAFLSIAAPESFDSRDSAGMKIMTACFASGAEWLPVIPDNEWFPVMPDDRRFPIIPDYINKISYDVKKTDSEMALISQIEDLCRELSEKLNDNDLSLFKESQLLWTDYYRKETFGLNPANNFVVIKIDGEEKKLNVYRRNMELILEGRKLFLAGLVNNDFDCADDRYDEIFESIGHLQARVEYFSEERNRMRVFAGESAWKLFLKANAQFSESFFAGSAEKIEECGMYDLKERLKILELQIIALEQLRIERED